MMEILKNQTSKLKGNGTKKFGTKIDWTIGQDYESRYPEHQQGLPKCMS